MLILLLLQVDMVMTRDNLGQGQVEQCMKSLGCRLTKAKHDLDRRKITGLSCSRTTQMVITTR